MPRNLPVKQITAWSFSRYNTYRQCPYKAKLKFIDKLTEPSTPALERGSQIHQLAEDYLKGKLSRLPPELKAFGETFRALRKRYQKMVSGMTVEDTWAFTKEWDQTTWNDWARCWVRIKLDCAHEEPGDVLIIRDWKTGKFRLPKVEEYVEQLELYALAALLLFPHLKEVCPVLDFLDEAIEYPRPEDEPLIFTPADIPRLKKLWAKRVKPMLADKRFAPRPNDLCRFCHFRAANGGPCKY